MVVDDLLGVHHISCRKKTSYQFRSINYASMHVSCPDAQYGCILSTLSKFNYKYVETNISLSFV